MGQKTREKEDAGINIKSSDSLIYNYKDVVTVKD